MVLFSTVAVPVDVVPGPRCPPHSQQYRPQQLTPPLMSRLWEDKLHRVVLRRQAEAITPFPQDPLPVGRVMAINSLHSTLNSNRG